MQCKLMDFPLLSHFEYILEQYYSASANVPVIRVPNDCKVHITMVRLNLVSDTVIPSATGKNLVRFAFGLSGGNLPNLRHCQRLKYLTVWPSRDLEILGGIRGLPDSILLVQVKTEDRIHLDEDREDLALVRAYFADQGWCTFIVSPKLTSVDAMYYDLHEGGMEEAELSLLSSKNT